MVTSDFTTSDYLQEVAVDCHSVCIVLPWIRLSYLEQSNINGSTSDLQTKCDGLKNYSLIDNTARGFFK